MSVLLLSQSSEYALRAMACIAAHDGAAPARAVDVAAMTHIPLPYLQKVLRRLVVAGLLNGRKGHHGGFALALPAAQIPFSRIIRATDDQMDAEHCAFGFDRCNAARPCPLHPAYSVLRADFLRWAETQTLATVDCSGLSARFAAEPARIPRAP